MLLTEAEHKHTGADDRFYEIKASVEERVKNGSLILQQKENEKCYSNEKEGIEEFMRRNK